MSDIFPLSLTQTDIYLDQIKYEDCPLYNIGGYIELNGISVDRLQIAHHALVTSLDCFGIRISKDKNNLSQYISANRNSELELIDLSGPKSRQKSQAWCDRLFSTPITYMDSQLCFASLIKLSKSEYWYVGYAHHLAIDGVGFFNWAEQLSHRYNQVEEIRFGKPGLTWKEVVESDKSYLTSSKYQRDRQHWQNHCEQIPEERFRQNYVNQFEGSQFIGSERYTRKLSKTTLTRLSKYVTDKKLGVSQVIQSMLAVYFSFLSGFSPVTFGIPAHNRRNSSQKQFAGVFTSISPLIAQVSATMSFEQLVREMGSIQIKNYRHQRYPIGHIINDIKINQGSGGLYDVMFNYLNVEGRNIQFDEHLGTLTYLSHNCDQTPLTINVWHDDDLEFQIDYNLRYFCAFEIELLTERFDFLLNELLKNDQKELAEIKLLSNSEEQYLLIQGKGHSPQRQYWSIYRSISGHGQINPERTALRFGSKTLSYQELTNSIINCAVALNSAGVKPGDTVAIYLDRGLTQITTCVTLLSLGVTFVPIDTSNPISRAEFQLRNSQSNFVIQQKSYHPGFSNIPIIVIELPENLYQPTSQTAKVSDFNYSINLEAAAYIIYTSGSTGKPKGVEVSQLALHNHIADVVDYLQLRSADNVFQMASYAFDAFYEQTLSALTCGASLHVTEERTTDFNRFFNYLRQHAITIADLPITYLSHILSASEPSDWHHLSLAKLVVGGESLPRQTIIRWFKLANHEQCQLINAYGPTETVITATYRKVKQQDGCLVSIGRVLGDRHMYVCDEQLRLLPYGEVGELYIGGRQLANGYVNNIVLSQEKFINDPFSDSPNARMYKTGDLVRWLPDHSLEFIGRIDEQIKIRGYRIETSEIEHVLCTHQSIESAIVTQQSQGENSFLVAYLKPAHESSQTTLHSELLVSDVKAHIKRQLPQHMVPVSFNMVRGWPLNSSGKIDRKKLPPATLSTSERAVKLSTETEIKLGQLWGTLLLLPIQQCYKDSEFFESGGNSLYILNLINSIEEEFDVRLEPKSLFENTTIADQAYLIDAVMTQNKISGQMEDGLDKEFGDFTF